MKDLNNVGTQSEASASDQSAHAMRVKQWLEIRKRHALTIDPETAEVMWTFEYTIDPYGVHQVPEEYQCVGREYFARAPGSDVWVWFGDLPDETAKRLWAKHHSELAFPAGHPCLDPRSG